MYNDQNLKRNSNVIKTRKELKEIRNHIDDNINTKVVKYWQFQ